ncbi:unnamed protein product [Ostreobium quekettii]|uniref:Protein kinase domain-containing protein n=1 Tax=Ostreobium quekettii TaxID=121088 RepID=A0A8S1J4X1_9CHLO|nr:unnamed protein product [Ostreobium quekettii]
MAAGGSSSGSPGPRRDAAVPPGGCPFYDTPSSAASPILEAFGLASDSQKSLRWVPEGEECEVSRCGQVGQGTFAVVSKCLREGQAVARKQLKPWAADDEEQLRWFMSEAALLSKLDHRHIVRHEGIGLERSDERLVPFQLQEFAEGGAMEDLLRGEVRSVRPPKYGLATGLKWCVQVARAVEYLHSTCVRVVHRDLKLGNILLTVGHEDLSQASIRLADFGLAVELSEAEAQARQEEQRVLEFTGNGDDEDMYSLTSKTGSWLYMAPEVFLGKAYNHKADVYSLGVIILEVLTGRLMSDTVLRSRSWEEAKRFAGRVAKGYRPRLPQEMPKELADVVVACWRQDPSRRPSASEVVELLESFQGHIGPSDVLFHPFNVSKDRRTRSALRKVRSLVFWRVPSLRGLGAALKAALTGGGSCLCICEQTTQPYRPSAELQAGCGKKEEEPVPGKQKSAKSLKSGKQSKSIEERGGCAKTKSERGRAWSMEEMQQELIKTRRS